MERFSRKSTSLKIRLVDGVKRHHINRCSKKEAAYNKILGQRKGSLVAADNKRNARIANIKFITETSVKELGHLSKRDRFIFGIALYAGEGGKTDGKGAFTNSNPYYINFMSNWLKEFCEIPKSELYGSIWIHENNDVIAAKKYWAKISNIPIAQIHKCYIAKNKTSSNKIRKNIHIYGIFSIKFYRSNTQRKIMGWISAFLSDKIASTQ